jgi:hypothetical protein
MMALLTVHVTCPVPSVPPSKARSAARDLHQRRRSDEVLEMLEALPSDPPIVKAADPAPGVVTVGKAAIAHVPVEGCLILSPVGGVPCGIVAYASFCTEQVAFASMEPPCSMGAPRKSGCVA